MKLAIQLYNFSYYHSSDTIYIVGTVYEISDHKTRLQTSVLLQPEHLENKRLNFQYAGKDIKDVLPLLKARIVNAEVESVEESKDPKHGPKYIISRIERCALLQVWQFFYIFN